MGGQLTTKCEGCKHINENECSKYPDTSWVERRGGCNFNIPGTIYTGLAAAKETKKRAGQQKQGKVKTTDLDLTQGGLFPNCAGSTGIGWRTIHYKGKKLHQTPGRDKPYGKATPLARYLAKKSRGYKHSLYRTQCEKWRSIK